MPTQQASTASSLPRLSAFLKVAGPGLVVMLADTDVGSLITAAQSGAKWGYSLLLLQILLIPILYIVQELTVRLGTATGRGHGELILDHYGPVLAWISYAGLVVAGVGAIVTEFSGIAGIGDLFGVPRLVSLGLPAALLLLLVFTGSYKKVERVAIVVGLFELVFVGLAVAARPDPEAILKSFAHIPLGNGDFRVLIAANIGAVIMPWMIFYQQSAIVDKGLGWDHMRRARLDTFIGAVISQCVMGAILLTAAATIGKAADGSGQGLQTVGDLAKAFTPALGSLLGQAVFGVGIIAAAFVALNVVALALAWGFGDVTRRPHSLEKSPREAPAFYAIFAIAVVAGAITVQLVSNLVALNVAVEVMNALLLPLALGLLILLATRALPEDKRVKGAYKWVVYAIAGLTIAFAMVGVLDAIGLI
ncbi:NRAMP family divalent metal transporter [Methylobacterium persicinum]|uniref:Mn2+/Fe2+ NRAMP family transporter n=1 Tax=Methylobacterium persicinum TaxID=374426 RepID=A0ABU0HSQ7_9HYPH|nr:divalent metal cation transporter [Methylobacterium persicinum]MDQ0444730.1 Mn2+/Fe2+ NRAMP family transporter [Methylobacterium persicinum]GJE39712.1 Divalent metal cation transporter MntH [Methylobacterium persicinum]